MKPHDWLAVFRIITANTDSSNSDCVSLNGQKYHYQYIGDIVTKKGYLVVWNLETKDYTHFSRVGIPENKKFIPLDEAQHFEESIAKLNLEYDSSWQ